MLEFIKKPHSFICLVSAPASGKTSFLLNLIDTYPSYQWVFVSPLRALADEFRERLENREMIVLTAEKLHQDQYEYLFFDTNTIFVLDEFHLIYDWGYSFRYPLIDIWYKVSTSKAHALALTATLDHGLITEMYMDINRNYNQGFLLNYGNMQFKNPPRKQYFITQRSWHTDLLYNLIVKKKRVIVFVAYRHQVDRLVSRINLIGVNALGCKGGEVDKFREELALFFDNVQLIVSTSCLSHGVNLPSVDCVFITYTTSESFWLQMAARGGRRGEEFDLYSVRTRKPKLSELIHFYFRCLKHRMALCFWKEFSFINNPTKKEIS